MERRYGTCTFTNWKVQTKREVRWPLPISSVQCSVRLRRQLPGDSIPLQGILWMFMHSSSRLTYSFVNFFSGPPFAYALFGSAHPLHALVQSGTRRKIRRHLSLIHHLIRLAHLNPK